MTNASPIDILKQYWGYSAFRPLQEDIIQSVLGGRDTLALLPTGGGKSVCFQVPVLCGSGMGLVISPLIALMKDQVFQLKQRNITAEAIYSGMRYQDIDRILDNAVFGHLRFLYISPERLQTDILKERLPRMPIRLIIVDEAHCISQWGYDFRPPYLELAKIREEIGTDIPVMALTATAPPEVAADIRDRLAFKPNGQTFQKSFIRPNLSYSIIQTEGKRAKLGYLLSRVAGSAIVYVRSRRQTKELAVWLKNNHISADFYHAGLDMEERSNKQEAWIQGKTRIMVSTNAFGMGIDKPDVRLVVHMELPDSLEAYYQEAGRAGRDEKKAYAVLLYSHQEADLLERQHHKSFPDMPFIRQVYRALGSYYQLAVGGGLGDSYPFDLVPFCQTFKLSPPETMAALKVLEQAGWITLSENIFNPAQVWVKTEREQLYDYMLRNPKHEKILKALLRTYQGVAMGSIAFRESQLAYSLKIPKAEVINHLTALHAEAIIEYLPSSDKPQLTFIIQRVDADEIRIDQERYAFRKERSWYRIQQAIDYAESDDCRSVHLAAYFGEKSSVPCGVCDVCLGRTKSPGKEDFQKYITFLQQILPSQGLPLEQVIQRFGARNEAKAAHLIQFFIQEGILVLQGETLFMMPADV